MALLGTGYRRLLILVIIAIGFLLVALNIFLNYKLRSEIPALLDRFSKESPYKIQVAKASLDPLFRIRFDRVSVEDTAKETEVLKVNEVTVNPDIVSSILSRKIRLGEVSLNKVVAQSNKENIEMLTEKGVEDFAIGSALFNDENPIAFIEQIKSS